MMPPPKHLVKKRDESITLRFRIEEVSFRPYYETPRKIVGLFARRKVATLYWPHNGGAKVVYTSIQKT